MERAYREDELLDATIVDSEGYVYGKVERINISENNVVLLAKEEKPDARTVADLNGLKEILLRDVKTPFGPRLSRATPIDMLAEKVRKELGLGAEEKLGDEHYIKYAERIGVSVPRVKATVARKEQKGTVNLNEVKTIRLTVIGKEKETRLIKIILLGEPKEAVFRKIPIQEKVPYRSSEVLKDRLVLDAEGNALGYVDSVVLFQDMLGIRIYVTKIGGQVNLTLLTKFLEEIGQSEAAELVEKHFENQKSSRNIVEVEELESFMREKSLAFRFPERVVASQGIREFVADIPWDAIGKIGDVVLLKSKSTDLRSKGYV